MTLKSGGDETQFAKLLNWLDPNPETAGEKYEVIRRGLIKMFAGKKCFAAEELADEVIDRVTKNIDQLMQTYEGDPARYFYAVARNVFLEYTRRPKSEEIPEDLAIEEKKASITDKDSECFYKCLETLDDEDKRLVVNYYTVKTGSKSDHRLRLSSELGITPDHLRVRAHRIKQRLQKCAKKCRAKKKL